ncbi:MAG: S8 family serine peptidase [Gemmatimonadetes bacterium]|nr:S8 family serine peptidase [Gemmatimonadota bacterium]
MKDHSFFRSAINVGALALLLVSVGCSGDLDPVSSLGEQTKMMAPVAKRAAPVVPGRYIVVLEDGVSAADVPGRARGLARKHGGQEEQIYRHALKGFAARGLSQSAAARLRDEPGVKIVEQDRVWTLNKRGGGKGPGGGGGGGGCQTQTVPWGIARVGGVSDGSSLTGTAWIIDTGISGVSDLNLNTEKSANFVTKGKNSSNDGNGHGTHVAGTVAAKDNGCDVVGVAAGAEVAAVRVLDNRGSGYTSWIVAGIDYVAANGVAGDVANMSLGGYSGTNETAMDVAVKQAADQGILFAIAAGNSAEDASYYTPAHIENKVGVYTVSAIGTNDCLASFSNYGSPVDVAAPGVGVESLAKDGGTVTYSGTSMAAPHVAGLLLLGLLGSDGTACGDPDGNPDLIAYQ